MKVFAVVHLNDSLAQSARAGHIVPPKTLLKSASSGIYNVSYRAIPLQYCDAAIRHQSSPGTSRGHVGAVGSCAWTRLQVIRAAERPRHPMVGVY